MSDTIVFENPGEIDLRVVTSFGVSVKDTSNPIGYFGTGLKFALATLLRGGHHVTICSGAKAYEVARRTETVRGEFFDFLVLRSEGQPDVETGFTTQLGKNWQTWMAYRELSSNMRDERGREFAGQPVPPRAGLTQIIVTGRSFAETFAMRDRYILQDEPDFVIGNLAVRRRQGSHFYFRGVRVHDFGSPSLFTYSTEDAVALTEDRTLKHPHQMSEAIRKALFATTDETFIEDIVTAPQGFWEHGLDFDGWGDTPGPTFTRVVTRLASDRNDKLNRTARKVVEKLNEKEFVPKQVLLTGVQQQIAIKAAAFCKRIGCDAMEDYPVIFAETLGSHGLGLAKNGIIYISLRAFEMGGAKCVAGTMIEEWIHLKHGHEDCDRGMQNYLLDKLVSIGEEMIGEPL